MKYLLRWINSDSFDTQTLQARFQPQCQQTPEHPAWSMQFQKNVVNFSNSGCRFPVPIQRRIDGFRHPLDAGLAIKKCADAFRLPLRLLEKLIITYVQNGDVRLLTEPVSQLFEVQRVR